MKTWRVRETYLVTQWTYIEASNEDEAIAKLENGYQDGEIEIDRAWESTDYETLQEVKG